MVYGNKCVNDSRWNCTGPNGSCASLSGCRIAKTDREDAERDAKMRSGDNESKKLGFFGWLIVIVIGYVLVQVFGK